MKAHTEVIKKRIYSIDALRGIVMMIMLMDHVRERFYLHAQVLDPMDVTTTPLALYLTRYAAHFCAPVFIFLTGLSASLYGQKEGNSKKDISEFLLKRGFFLIILEITLVNFSWMGSFHTLWLQVMWAIGLSMIALAGLIHLPKKVALLLSLLIIFGHNALEPINFDANEFGYTLWSILHDRGYIFQSDFFNIKVSYPVLPWIGTILLGFHFGPLFSKNTDAKRRQGRLIKLGFTCLFLFFALRFMNFYGESLPWSSYSSVKQTVMSFFNITKYPPSLNFLLITLGVMFVALSYLERMKEKTIGFLSVFGGAPMFFYLIHLYSLLILYTIASFFMAPNHGNYISFNSVAYLWPASITLNLLLYYPTKKFSQFKRKSKNPILKYF